jgi:hypothetical protein
MVSHSPKVAFMQYGEVVIGGCDRDKGSEVRMIGEEGWVGGDRMVSHSPQVE